MRLIQNQQADSNYLSKIIRVTEFLPHPNADNLHIAIVDGYHVIISKDMGADLYIYFPVLSVINPDFLAYNNLFRKSNLNRDPNVTGFFESDGRVRPIKIRGVVSEGFLLPEIALNKYVWNSFSAILDFFNPGVEFNAIEDHGKEFWFSRKWIPKHIPKRPNTPYQRRQRHLKGLNKIIDTQFRFHYDTAILQRNPQAINADNIIHISSKINGTSGISAYVLCHKKLSWRERLARWLTGCQFDTYDHIYASRTVIKNKFYNEKVTAGFYGCDIWAEADKIVAPHLKKGETAYYEIVGFLPNGNYIQKGYDYGCVPRKEGELFRPEKHFKVRIYRVTMTNIDGEVIEYTPHQVQDWCRKAGLRAVTEWYVGRAGDLYPDLDPNVHWGLNFIERLSNDTRFYMELDSPDCVNPVPQEGIVIKIDNGITGAFKLKTFRHLNKRSTAQEYDIEDES